MMFSAFCQEAGREVLLGPDNFADLRHGPDGFELHFDCHCGRRGVVFPGRGAAAACGSGDAARLRMAPAGLGARARH